MGIKSAFEHAWERASKLEVGESKLLELQYTNEGEKLAAHFLKDKDFDLMGKINQFPEEVRDYIRKGTINVFLSNINFPQNERQRQEGKRSLEGLRLIKRDKSLLSHIISRIDSLFAYYERDRQEYYEKLRSEFEEKLREALAQQGIKLTAPIQVERYPEFQQKWQEVSFQLNRGYEIRLNMLKAELAKIR